MRRALCPLLWVTLLFGLALASRPATAQSCPADYDGNGVVNEDDLHAFLDIWYDAVEADFDQNGQVTEDDVPVFVTAYLAGLPEADVDHNGHVSLDDLYYYLQAYARVTHSPSTDFDGDGNVTQSGGTDPGDLFAFLDHWYGGC